MVFFYVQDFPEYVYFDLSEAEFADVKIFPGASVVFKCKFATTLGAEHCWQVVEISNDT